MNLNELEQAFMASNDKAERAELYDLIMKEQNKQVAETIATFYKMNKENAAATLSLLRRSAETKPSEPETRKMRSARSGPKASATN